MKSVWEGVYESFEEAGGSASAFESDEWIKKSQERALNFLNSKPYSRDYPLAPMLAILFTMMNRVEILDIGGAMGGEFLDILKKVPAAAEKLHYYVVDNAKTIKNIPKEIKQFKNLKFYANLSDIPHMAVFDVIHFGSSLQYIEDYKQCIKDVKSSFGGKYFVFSDLMVGDVPEFVTHQISYDKRMPVKILNIDKFKVFMYELGYKLLFQSKFITPILGKEDVYPNEGLPETLRLDRTSNFIYSSLT